VQPTAPGFGEPEGRGGLVQGLPGEVMPLDQRALLHERAQELQLSLMDLALGGAGPDKIIERLAEVTGLPAAWLDEGGEVRHLTVTDGALLADVEEGADALRRWGGTIAAVGADPPVREFTVGRNGLASLVTIMVTG